MERKEVVGLTDFGGCMTLKGQTGIRFRHTFSVINYLYRRPARIDHYYVNGLGTSIHRIFYQLLNDRGWTLYDLTSCYLVSHAIRKKMYQITHLSQVAWDAS